MWVHMCMHLCIVLETGLSATSRQLNCEFFNGFWGFILANIDKRTLSDSLRHGPLASAVLHQKPKL